MMVDDEDLGTGVRGRDKDGRSKTKTVGVLEKRANVTLIGGEVVIGKEARGNVKVSPQLLLVLRLVETFCFNVVQHARHLYVSVG
jgi:hypothetical protein